MTISRLVWRLWMTRNDDRNKFTDSISFTCLFLLNGFSFIQQADWMFVVLFWISWLSPWLKNPSCWHDVTTSDVSCADWLHVQVVTAIIKGVTDPRRCSYDVTPRCTYRRSRRWGWGWSGWRWTWWGEKVTWRSTAASVRLSVGRWKKKPHTLNPSLTVRVLAAHSQMDFLSFSFFLDDIFFDTVRHLWDCQRQDHQREQRSDAVLPEGPAGYLWRYVSW